MTDALHLELVTPDARVLSEAVYMVVVPGELGDFGVMAHHAPFVSMIRPGKLEVYLSETKIERYFVGGGYANVSNNTCIVLAESLQPLASLDKAVITEELAGYRAALVKVESDIKRTALERHILEAETKLLFA
jgi:F-type H+-transporting ATPase subunit epsilon